MSAPRQIVDGFQWLAIPHGVENGKLKITIRVVPLLSRDCFKIRDDAEFRLRDLDPQLEIGPVLDWPRFVRSITKFEVGFAPVRGGDGNPATDDVSTRRPAFPAFDAKPSSDLWRSMFNALTRVCPQDEPGGGGCESVPARGAARFVQAMPHAAGANLLRSAIGRAHIFGLLDYRWPPEKEGTKGVEDIRPHIVRSKIRIEHRGPLNEFARELSKPLAARESSDERLEDEAYEGPIGATEQRDLDRLTSVLPGRLVDRALLKKISEEAATTIVSLSTASPESMKRFILHRALATAPDLPAPSKSTKRFGASDGAAAVSERARREEETSDRPEFHRDLGKATSHPWLLRALGLSFDAQLDLPSEWNGTGALYVHSVEYREGGRKGKFSPRVEFRSVTASDASSEPWHPKPLSDSPYSDGCVCLTKLVETDTAGELVPAFALEQLDIDSATEKLMHVAQTLASQFEAGVTPEKREATWSTMRTTGISLLMRTSAQFAKRAEERRRKVADAATRFGRVDLYADDLIVGLRADVCSLQPDVLGGACVERWKSLSRRQLKDFEVDGKSFAWAVGQFREDESFCNPHSRLVDHSSSIDPGQSRKLPFEELFCWRGWSLSVPNVESSGRRRDLRPGVPSITYTVNGGLPKQRFGWGYQMGARAVYVDGGGLTLEQARARYQLRGEELTLGTPLVGTAKPEAAPADPNRYFAPFLRYEAVQPAKVVARNADFDRKGSEREERLLVTSDGHGRVIRSKTQRELAAPVVELECAIRAGMFDDPMARRSRPQSGFVPDPWAKRMILGIYRKADGELLRMEYWDYYDERHLWPNARPMRLQLIADAEILPAQGFLSSWDGDTYSVRLAAGMELEVRHWHEMEKEMLASSGVVEAMARWLTSTPVETSEVESISKARADLGIETICDDFCDMRDRLIKVLSQWHQKFPFDLRPYFASGLPARDVALTSFSMLNPAGGLDLVHAVPIPAREPRFSDADSRDNKRLALLPMMASEVARRFGLRREIRGQTAGEFGGDIEIHRASTERVECFGQWEDIEDDPSKPEPVWTVQTHPMFRVNGLRRILKPLPTLVAESIQCDGSIAARPGARFDVPPDNDLLMLDSKREEVGRLENDDLGVHEPHFDFLDAKARLIDFELRAVSRFANDFPKERHYRDCGSKESRWLKATMPPARPEVAFVVPLFEKEDEEKGATIRRRRRGGWFRIWLERPWFSSGQGELLALVCAPGNLFRARGGAGDYLTDPLKRAWGSIKEAVRIDSTQGPQFRPSEQLQRLYTGWGLDPIWSQPKRAKLFYIPPGAFTNRVVPDLPGPMVPSQFADRRDVPKEDLEVAVALYRPEYDKEERRWFADVHIQPDDYAYFPFVRLGLARFQPNAIEGCELSEIVATEFVQLTPDRSATVSVSAKGAEKLVRLEVVGQAPVRLHDGQELTRMIMRVDREVGVESGKESSVWEPVVTADGKFEEVALSCLPEGRNWSASAEYKLSSASRYSIYIEEHEPILVDDCPTAPQEGEAVPSTRIVFVDRIPLRQR